MEVSKKQKADQVGKFKSKRLKFESKMLKFTSTFDPVVYGEEYISKGYAKALTTVFKAYARALEHKIKEMDQKENKLPKKGDDLDHFYFIRRTKHGCPKVEYRKVGDKGITHIEVTNVGKSYQSEKHLKKIRVTGLKEDGKTEYQMYFKDVFTEPSNALKNKYREMSNQYIKSLDNEIYRLEGISIKHARIIDESRMLIKDIPCDEM